MEERHVPPQSFYPDTTDCACMCPTDPDLILLRKAAISERKGIYHYLCAAEKTSGPICKLFTELAQDEMIHFRRSMALLAKYDSIQDCAFNDACINLPPADSFRKSKNCCALEVIEILTKSITGELEDINMYQEFYLCAKHNDVKIHFCETGNDEKIHLARLWKAIMSFTNENTCKP